MSRDERKSFVMFVAGFSSAFTLAAALHLALSTRGTPGWVCADFGNEVVSDALQVGRAFVWIDRDGRPHKAVPGGEAGEDWYCVQSDLNARQLSRPIGTDAEAYR